MRVAVAGASGNIGSLTVAALQRHGHDPVPISRSHGVDLLTGRGLDEALNGVDAVIDALSAPPADREATATYFATTTQNLLRAEQQAGVRHHVVLSIVEVHRIAGTAHYSGKREQERLVSTGPVPWTIVPATQFFDFAATVTKWTEQDGIAYLAPLLVQPIAPADVAEFLTVAAAGPPQGRHPDVAGPDRHDLVDMARRTHQAMGRVMKIVPTWEAILGADMAGNVLLPGPDARIASTTFDDWLAEQQPE
ncbi:SDR family oxidoreductase [Micromonospora sp. 4G55]|uniref:SDR family oxidoreductase n=1 Tax=Micromonospora sp. 4G55 TaxID=2806102 RepID=UPI001A551448|nr:NAD(P)H-binding protein [Micromonospora sp. 4G55]MBM0256626.1 NAD(P)H-binding protein [Micromonospora sp. 4G55]